jgi:hypothetical protein
MRSINGNAFAVRVGPARAAGWRNQTIKAVLMAGVAFVPCAAQAVTVNWTGTTSNAWETPGNWSGTVGTATSIVIGTTTNNPVQLNSSVTPAGVLTVGTGLGSTEALNINSGDTLTMGAHTVTLAGGSITGLGTLSASTISGFGTISSLVSGTTFNANATVGGTAFGGFSPFVNGTPGAAITLIGQSNLSSDTFNVSNRGNFNFQGVTLTTPTFNGVSNNLNAGSSGGNNYYGLFSFSGAASTISGQLNNANYEQIAINGTTLHLNNFSLTNNWNTGAPPTFVINAGGTLDNSLGNSNLTSVASLIMNGGSLTNTAGGTFIAPGKITGTGLVSGPLTVTGGLTASGGTLTVDGTAGTGVTAASAGWSSSAGSVLDLKGNINFSPVKVGISNFPAAPALNPGGGTIQLDGATINTTGGSGQIQVGSGQVNVASGVNTLNGSFVSPGTTASYSVANGATLSLQNQLQYGAGIESDRGRQQGCHPALGEFFVPADRRGQQLDLWGH